MQTEQTTEQQAIELAEQETSQVNQENWKLFAEIHAEVDPIIEARQRLWDSL